MAPAALCPYHSFFFSFLFFFYALGIGGEYHLNCIELHGSLIILCTGGHLLYKGVELRGKQVIHVYYQDMSVDLVICTH